MRQLNWRIQTSREEASLALTHACKTNACRRHMHWCMHVCMCVCVTCVGACLCRVQCFGACMVCFFYKYHPHISYFTQLLTLFHFPSISSITFNFVFFNHVWIHSQEKCRFKFFTSRTSDKYSTLEYRFVWTS